MTALFHFLGYRRGMRRRLGEDQAAARWEMLGSFGELELSEPALLIFGAAPADR